MLKLLENIWLKIGAILIGLLLWFHVATEKIYMYQTTLPVTEIALGEGLTLSQNPPESLLVGVSATGKQLLRRKWRDEGIRILATKYKSGRHTINLDPTNTSLSSTSSSLTLEEVVFPSNIALQIDHEAQVQVQVASNLVAIPDKGFTVRGVSDPMPGEVTLYGPRSLLGRFTTVFTEARELTGIRSDVDLTLALVTPDAYGVRLEPDSVRLRLEVVPIKTRVYESVPVVVFNAPVGKNVAVAPATVRVELTGPPEDVDLLNENAVTVSVDFLEATPQGRAKVSATVPTSFRVKKVIPDSVRVNVDE